MNDDSKRGWPLWEVFVRARRGLAHQHVGSLHAPDGTMALQRTRDGFPVAAVKPKGVARPCDQRSGAAPRTKQRSRRIRGAASH